MPRAPKAPGHSSGRENPWAGSNRRSQLPPDWPAIRARVLKRDDHRCVVIENGLRCDAPARDVDHIRRGNNHSLENLRACCTYHHRKKTSAEGRAARKPRPTMRRPPEPHPGLLPAPLDKPPY